MSLSHEQSPSSPATEPAPVSSPSPVPSPAAIATANPTSGEAEGPPKRKRTRRTKKSDDGAAAATGKTRKPKKGKNGSDQPKKPVVMNGYMRWLVAVGRKQVTSANTGIKTTDVAKECGRLWREMSAEEKTKWSAPK